MSFERAQKAAASLKIDNFSHAKDAIPTRTAVTNLPI